MQRGIKNSKVMLVCVSPAYQNSDNTMFELRYAHGYVDPESGQKKTIVTVVLEASLFQWGSDELKQLCDIRSPGGTMYVDLSSVVRSYPRDEAAARTFQASSSVVL